MINVTSDIWSGTSPSGVMTVIDRLGRRTQAAQIAEAAHRQHLDPARRDDADKLVPLQVQRAGIVGLELEPAAAELCDLAGDAIAVGERDDVGPPLGMSWSR